MTFDCVTCGACCLGIPMMEVAEDYYNKYKEMFEFRGLFGVQKSGKYYFMTQKCKHLIIDNYRYVCGIQDTKPAICKEFPKGSKECLEARAFWERITMTIGGKEIARHPPIAPEHFTEGKMGCDKCSAAAPSFPSAGDEYTCPFCKQRWRLTCEAPGAYWETIETYNSEKALSERLKSEFGKEME